MKTVSLVAHETRRVQAEDQRARSALAGDLYAAIEPLRVEIAQLRREVDQLKARIDIEGTGVTR